MTKYTRIRSYTLITIAALSWIFLSPLSAFFTSVLLIWWTFAIDPRVLVSVALLLVFGMAAFFTLKLDDPARNLAVYVYTLLIISAVLFLLEALRFRRAHRL